MNTYGAQTWYEVELIAETRGLVPPNGFAERLRGGAQGPWGSISAGQGLVYETVTFTGLEEGAIYFYRPFAYSKSGGESKEHVYSFGFATTNLYENKTPNLPYEGHSSLAIDVLRQEEDEQLQKEYEEKQARIASERDQESQRQESERQKQEADLEAEHKSREEAERNTAIEREKTEDAALSTSLRRASVPTAENASIKRIIARDGASVTFSPLGPGKLTISWYYQHKDRRYLVAYCETTVDGGGTKRLLVRLTSVGKRLLERAKRISLGATAVFAPAEGGSSDSATAPVVLHR